MRVEVRRQRGDERLAFAGDHFGDVALVQDHAADQLHVVVAHARGNGGRLRGKRQTLRPGCRRASRRPSSRRRNSAVWFRSSSSVIAWYFGFQRIDRVDLRLQALEEPRVGRAEQAGDRRARTGRGCRCRYRTGFPKCVQEFPWIIVGKGGAERIASADGRGPTTSNEIMPSVSIGNCQTSAAERCQRRVTCFRQKVYSDMAALVKRSCPGCRSPHDSLNSSG